MAEGIPDGWREVKLGEVASKIGSGVTPKGGSDSYLEAGIPLIRSQNVLWGHLDLSDVAFISEVQHEKMRATALKRGDVLLNITGASIGRSCIYDFSGEANVNQHVCIIRPTPEAAGEFIKNFLLSKMGQQSIELFQAGGNRQGLNFEQVKSFSLILPPLPEQQKIAAILSTWDESISTLTKLLAAKQQQKRGLAEQLLTGKRRLKGFEGEWERVQMSKVFTRITRKNTEGNERALTISGTHGLIDQREFFNKRVAAADLSGYYLIRHGEFAYNKSYSTGYDFGAIKRLNRYDEGVVSTLYICFGLTNSDAVSDFYEQFFEAGLLNEGISGIAQEGARNHGLLNVSAKDFFELPIPFPSPPEQRAIASILSTLDAEISSLMRLKASVQQQKRGLMEVLLTGRVRVAV